MDEVLTIQEAADILKRIPIANTREMKAVYMAIEALEEKWRERWRPVMDGDGEMPPTDEDGYSKYILVNFTNVPEVFDIGQYRTDSEGGNFFSGDDDDPYTKIGAYVSAWRPLPPEEKIEMLRRPSEMKDRSATGKKTVRRGGS